LGANDKNGDVPSSYHNRSRRSRNASHENDPVGLACSSVVTFSVDRKRLHHAARRGGTSHAHLIKNCRLDRSTKVRKRDGYCADFSTILRLRFPSLSTTGLLT